MTDILAQPMDNASHAARCVGKERFESATLAHQVVRRTTASKRRRGKLRGALKAYHCTDCGGYHIGGVA